MESITQIKTQILEKTDLSALIRSRVDLSKQSGRLVGCCPFHGEKTPSFYVFYDHYHCFGCGAHGDAISWVQHFEGFGFVESLKWLGNKCQVDISSLEQSKISGESFKRLSRIEAIKSYAQDFFVAQLYGSQGRRAKEYLISRGFQESELSLYGFGFAPDNPRTLHDDLQRRGFQLAEIQEASLITAKDQRFYDFFRDRVMIPIRDIRSRIIAFAGRTLNDHPLKYKNSRYDKGLHLFGMDQARLAMREKARAIVVEGYMDVFRLWRSGFKESVACQGTALTHQHMKLLSSTTGVVYLFFDGDTAGQRAALKAFDLAIDNPDLIFKAAVIPNNEDPDSFILKNGADAFESLIDQAKDLVTFVIDEKLSHKGANNVPLIVSQEVLPWVDSVKDPIKRDYLLHQVSSRSGISHDVLARQLQGKLAKKPSIQRENLKSHEKLTVTPQAPLTVKPLLYEFFGHIYAGAPFAEGICHQLKDFFQKDLEEDPRLSETLLRLLYLKTKEQVQAYFESLSHELEWQKLIDELRKKEGAFVNQNPEIALKKLQLIYKQNKIVAVINKLKLELAAKRFAAQPDYSADWQHLAQEINQLNQNLWQLKKQETAKL